MMTSTKRRLAASARIMGCLVVLLGMGALPAPTDVQAQGTPAKESLKEGRDYTLVSPAQPVEVAGKIEVLEFFSYACPHCFDFDPVLNTWAKAAPKDVVLRRVPITFGREQWVPLARLYYALEASNDLPRLHSKVFEALHKENVNFTDEKTLLDWVEKQGVDRQKFTDLYKSFSIQSKVTRAQQAAVAYKIQGVPALAVQGKYLVGSDLSAGHAGMLRVTDHLIGRARAEQGKK